MKKLFLSSVLLTALFISCKKDNSLPASVASSGVSADINGKPVTFNYTVQLDTAKGMFLQAAKDSSIHSDIIWISISGGALKPGTYSYLSIVSGTATYYMNQQGTPSPFTSYDATVTITSIDSGYVKGSFQGTGSHYSQNNRGGMSVDSTITITNGRFAVKIPKLQ